MDCEICGQNKGSVFVEIDGSRLFTCNACSSLGRPSEQNKFVHKPVFQGTGPKQSFDDFEFTEGFGRAIQKAREKKGLSINEFALLIRERESFLHKVEQEKALPDKALAKKIEGALGVKILQ